MQCCLAGRRISVHVYTCLYMCISSFVLLLCRFCFPSLFSDMAKGPVSKGIKCLGVFATGERCKRSRDKAGLRVVLKRVCDSCTEQRCKAHCECARTNAVGARGRSAARGPGTARQSSRVSQSPGLVAAPAPNGRPSAESFQYLDVDDFYSQCCSDLATASEVEMATFCYDEPELQKVLLRRLKDRTDFKLTVFIDAEMYGGTVPKCQGTRVRELLSAGASVFLCKGRGGRGGSFHIKAIVIDRRRVFAGSCNFTARSRRNEELCHRATGRGVAHVLGKLMVHKRVGKPLHEV